MIKRRFLSVLLALLTVLSLLPAAQIDAASLKKGSQGSDVKQLQQNLIGMGYLDGTADGVYGGRTQSAVQEFQRDFGLAVDGNAGQATQCALRNAVVRLQVELKSAGYAPGSADGKFGAKTKKALKAYQEDKGLSVTGAADSATWAAINRRTSGMKVSFLKKGSSGSQVKHLQKALIGLGYLDGSADGQYGAKTASAVRAYQRDYGLVVDGTAGKNTMISMKNTVVALQSDLTRKGCSTNGVDGIFGGGTKSAVKAYQRSVGISETGIAGSKTMKKLYGYDLNGNAGSTDGGQQWKIWIEPLYQDGDDSRIWYDRESRTYRTVDTSGCGGVALAMALNALKNTDRSTGKSVMLWFVDHGYYYGNGTKHEGILEYPRELGLKSTYCSKSADLIEHLKKGRLAVVLIKDMTGRATFTYSGGGGHYILVSGYREHNGVDQIFVNNPLSYKSSDWYNLKELMRNWVHRSDLKPCVIIYK